MGRCIDAPLPDILKLAGESAGYAKEAGCGHTVALLAKIPYNGDGSRHTDE